MGKEFRENYRGLEILGPNGFEPFWGMMKKTCRGKELRIGDKLVKCSEDHQFNFGNAQHLAGIPIYQDFFGPIGVRDSWYLSEGLVNHNCELYGSSETLVSLECLNKQEVKDPVAYMHDYHTAIWEDPVPGGLYVMGIDTSTGSGLDFAAIQVLRIVNRDRYDQVAVFHSDREEIGGQARIAVELSEKYNGAKFILESNGTGSAVANEVWYNLDCENLLNTDSRGLGTRATTKSKLEACLSLKQEMERGALQLRDDTTVKELTTFIELSPNRFGASSRKHHDDLVSALYWAVWALKQPEIDLESATSESVVKKRSDLSGLDAYGSEAYGDSVFWY